MAINEQPRAVTLGQLLYIPNKESEVSCNTLKVEQMQWSLKSEREIIQSPRNQIRPFYQSLELPIHTMEFLCRSWSPSASGLLQTFSASHQICCSEEKQDRELQTIEYSRDVYDREEYEEKKYIPTSANPKYCVFRPTSNILEAATNLHNRCKVKLVKNIKNFLKEKTFPRIFSFHREQNKEETRLATAKIHAALSVAQLAAAIAGYVGCEKSTEINVNTIVTGDMNMGNVIAYAAALVATVCAESAESAGADKAHVVAAVGSGLKAQTPADILALVATAATSLRGAATLESRAKPLPPILTISDAVRLRERMPIITPSGKREQELVSIQFRHGRLWLILEKKFLGLFKKAKKYQILKVITETTSGESYILRVICEGDEFKLVFENEQKIMVWTSSISNVLSGDRSK